jgi:hypothetical protein
LDVLKAALLVGVLGDALLRVTPWGLNVFIWLGAAVASSLVLLARWRPAVLRGEGRWLIFPLIFFSAAFAWRDSTMLQAIDILALLLTLALAGWRTRAGRIRLASIGDYLNGMSLAVGSALLGGFPLLTRDVRWKEVAPAGWQRHVRSVLVGLFIALPLLFLFGALLTHADAVFEQVVARTFNLDVERLAGHLVLAGFVAWLAGGFLRGMLMGREVTYTSGGRASLPRLRLRLPLAEEEPPAKALAGDEAKAAAAPFSLGIVETSVLLSSLNALFLVFVLVQLRYFFGGAGTVQLSSNLTYAEYARRGFFELVTVAALVLPLLLGAHWLLRKEHPAHERVFRALAGAQILLLFVIMASAVERMNLYQSEYGLTELRVYTTAFMGWLAVVFIWFAVTVLRGQRERFVCGALVAGLLVGALLHLLNPDALIVRTNLAHARAGRVFDAKYAASLSADAMPELAAALPSLNRTDQCVVARRIIERWSPPEEADWRTWNRSRAKTWRIVRENAGMLQGILCSRNSGGEVIPLDPNYRPVELIKY